MSQPFLTRPITAEEFSKILKAHSMFLATGGGGGSWQVLSVSNTNEMDTPVLGAYIGCNDDAQGEQAVLNNVCFNGISLKGVDLSYAQLCQIVCEEQDLSGIHLTGSLLYQARLRGSNLSNAILRNADLTRADLRDCDLRGADLSGADLEGAQLGGAKLSGT